MRLTYMGGQSDSMRLTFLAGKIVMIKKLMRTAAAIFLAVLSATQLGCEKYKLDRQMEELCRKDGGVKVYEVAMLPHNMFDMRGNPFAGWELRPPEQRLGNDYWMDYKTTYLKAGNPLKGEGRLSRHHWRIFRKSDGKMLGEGVSYGRSGGDFIVVGHFTSNSCPPQFGEATALINSVFVKEGN